MHNSTRLLTAITLAGFAPGMAVPVHAEQVVAVRAIRASATIGPEDVVLADGTTPGTAERVAEVLGQEAKVMLYPGRPIRLDQIGPPAIIERNQIVPVLFTAGALRITAEGRALDRAGSGEPARVLNLASRRMVTGVVMPDGSVVVGPENGVSSR